MVKFIIDGKKVSADKSTTILEVARANGINIPTLCNHESLDPSGACRLCVVEVTKGKRTRVVTSCIYQADEGIVVNTQTDRVKKVRELVMQLLMARCPDSKELKDLAAQLGIEPEPRYAQDTKTGKCILCRMCVRVCEKIVGVSAIGFSARGHHKIVGTPFQKETAVCIGCGACAYVCPTGHIEMKADDKGLQREIWGRTFKMQACDSCGRYFAPVDQLKYISSQTGVSIKELSVCTNCRK